MGSFQNNGVWMLIWYIFASNADDSTVHESNGDVYTGGFVENRRQGFGKCVYSNGDVYEGEWLNDLCHGQGTLTLATPSPTVSSSIQVLVPLQRVLMTFGSAVFQGLWGSTRG